MNTVNKDQQKAADPTASVWVSASAGSGKTKVLTDRVLNLLLLNGAPEKLLCLTFTKTAAAEMANRINNTLKSWAIIPDSELADNIFALTNEAPEEETIKKARQLFAKTLETKGGMKIMTIHSFCQSILKRFPLEANVPPYFEVIDESQTKYILKDAFEKVMSDPSLQTDFDILSKYLDENGLQELLQNILSNREDLLSLKEENASFESIFYKLKKKFNLYSYQSENDIILENYSLEEFSLLTKRYLKKDQKEVLKKYLDDPLAQQVLETSLAIQNFKNIQLTQSLLHIVFEILTIYQIQKKNQSLLDYDDLILNTKELLEKSFMSAWVLFKLDGGIDHILVDESQDTNPNQWAIIRMLAEEFFAGEGRSDALRTIFAVGDKKQSIYSFQGADPNEFERMRLFFEKKVLASQNSFQNVPLNLSYRSVQPVLDMVNYLLQNKKAAQGVLNSSEKATHLAFRKESAGLVEIWPTEPAEAKSSNEWQLPIRGQKPLSAMTRLAQKIALRIKKMLDEKEILESKGRPIEANDILILVQHRGPLMNEIIRCLKEQSIPVTGLDRLILTDHIAVQDLIALLRFVLLPTDDLNLACLLKSPLFNVSEEDLYHLCHLRTTHSLWEQVQNNRPDLYIPLSDLLNRADTTAPFEFFAYVLGPLNGRTKFLSRLGMEVNEALDEFLTLVINFEVNNVPSLEVFLHWITSEKIEIKRDLEQKNLNAVRIMTVHGSKGLQGNIVFLPDTRFVSTKKPSLLFTKDHLPLWFAKSDCRTPTTQDLFDALDAAQMDEYRRLLYVAITRACDRLYIGAYENQKKPKEGNWYDLICSSLPFAPDEDGIIRLTSVQTTHIKKSEKKESLSTPINIPEWFYQSAPTESFPPKPLSPSKMAEEEPISDSPISNNQALALRRGSFLHYLLQYLPDIAPHLRKSVAERMKPDDIEIPEQLYQLLKNPQFAAFFSKDSLAEVPIIGSLNDQIISGQIDRMLVRENEVVIIDYKTNQHVPQNVEQVPSIYKTQMRTYKQLIKNIFPDKVVKAYLLWLQNITLMEIE